MLTILRAAQFKKDFKRLMRSGSKDVEKIKNVIEKLSKREKLSEKYREHKLVGNYADYLECHIQPDWLLIYRIDEKQQSLVLVRTGSHADLFS